MSVEPTAAAADEPWPNRPLTGSEYFQRCLGTGEYVPLAGLGKHHGSHPVTIRRVFEEAKTQLPEAADVIASLVFFEAVDRNRDEFLLSVTQDTTARHKAALAAARAEGIAEGRAEERERIALLVEYACERLMLGNGTYMSLCNHLASEIRALPGPLRSLTPSADGGEG